MFSDLENSRPRPPSRLRRAVSNISKHELTSTPPPAYGSTFVFPSRSTPLDANRDILGSSIGSTMRVLAWDSRDSSVERDETISESDDTDWMSKKSRDELQELLFKAHGIIRERENELSHASTVVKQIYESNVVLKSKHEALLARIPISPPMSVSSLDSHSRTPTMRLSLSHSPSGSGLVGPPTTRTRKVSIAMADVSLLADQNAELLDKLQRLEEDATSADVAGRRELKRLEKEISYLRDALEKTQAKSEELEGKVHDAVANDVLRRKREIEAARHVERDDKATVINFAPPGSKFGGPSESTPRRSTDAYPGHIGQGDMSDRGLISQLLNKVKELEETNERIIQHQTETSNQLASVQQDAMNMSKIYEFLSDDDSVELEWNPDGDPSEHLEKEGTDPPTIRFRSLRRSIENSLSADGGFFYAGSNLGTKTRKSVMGLFDDSKATEEQSTDAAKQMAHRLSWTSSLSSAGATTPSGTLSPLSFFSPLSQFQSDIPQKPTLQNELEIKLGRGNWNWPGATHMRSESLSNLSQISVPTTPTPAPGSANRALPEELDYDSKLEVHEPGAVSVREKEMLASGNSLELSVESPTPEFNDQNKETPTQASQRLQHISQTLRLRKNRWVERMLNDRKSRDGLTKRFHLSSNIQQHLSDAVDHQAGDISTDTEATQAESGEPDNDVRRDPLAGSATPQPCRSSDDSLTGQETKSAIVKRADEQDGEITTNNSFLFQVWLWIQFVVVVLFFIFAMAKRGPRSVLVSDERAEGRRVVTRR